MADLSTGALLGKGEKPLGSFGVEQNLFTNRSTKVMVFFQTKCTLHNDRGFTLIELMLVVAIMGIIAAISIQQIQHNRARAYDSQAISSIKTVLNRVATDEPTGAASGRGMTLIGAGFPDIELPPGIDWNVVNDGADRWRFYFAHYGGLSGYYFWIPGDTCTATDDGAISSDRIDESQDKGVGSYWDNATP